MQITACVIQEGIPFEVIIEYEPPVPAYKVGHPDNWEPADPGICEPVSITIKDSSIDVSPVLSDKLITILTDKAIAHATA